MRTLPDEWPTRTNPVPALSLSFSLLCKRFSCVRVSTCGCSYGGWVRRWVGGGGGRGGWVWVGWGVELVLEK